MGHNHLASVKNIYYNNPDTYLTDLALNKRRYGSKLGKRLDQNSRNYGTPNFGAGLGNEMFDSITGIPPPAPYPKIVQSL